MTDRTLVTEFAPLAMVANGFTGNWELSNVTDYRAIETVTYPKLNYWASEHKLDLSGYTQNDLTVGFRRSFEQEGGSKNLAWNANSGNPLQPYDTAVSEQVIISSVPLTDEQLVLTLLTAPGFIPYNLGSTVDTGNFNRTHIIHGHLSFYDVQLDQIVDPTTDGASWLSLEQEYYYSSLEPTAADCLYCYRVFGLPTGAAIDGYGADSVIFGPKRVILDAFVVEEPTLEYMMRLKRSYELANQV